MEKLSERLMRPDYKGNTLVQDVRLLEARITELEAKLLMLTMNRRQRKPTTSKSLAMILVAPAVRRLPDAAEFFAVRGPSVWHGVHKGEQLSLCGLPVHRWPQQDADLEKVDCKSCSRRIYRLGVR